ncbi:acyl-CoA thioesterase [Sandaracinobacteroides saxicola]|uniref:Acyl-CoA thioesterase 2 n=1 Tax=Sandaracinobacteroides saxicola TaxID=2759707 RepID=A0A7G5IKG5_9SPHN|nr:acyl-CoA thioesterase II [Sandaracinobacteroides saxicola]QMW23857.1 acyl-CoA thioesterase II [Sandaracinobacteroides saxicola]
MPTALARLLTLLDVEELEVDLYRGRNGDEGWIRVYGGQVVAQALAAAQRTVPADRPVHSLHSYFIRPGEPNIPILYRVERERDGASFTTRRVSAIQHGRTIFSLTGSFARLEPGHEHADPIPAVAGPEGLMNHAQLHARDRHLIPEPWRTTWDNRDRPIEFRPLQPGQWGVVEKLPPVQQNWFRADGDLPDDPALHACVFAYATDMTLLDTCTLPHGLDWTDPRFQTASLDHSIWFHRPVTLDGWLLYAQTSPVAAHARGFNLAHVFTREGTLLATVAQEGLMRYRG